MQRVLARLHEQSLGTPLRQLSLPVTLSHITSKAFQRVCSSLLSTMLSHKGWGLAAPQCGHPLRVISLLVPRDLPSSASSPSPSLSSPVKGALDDVVDLSYAGLLQHCTPLVLINPVMTWSSRESRVRPEGCLSLPQVVGNVRRAVGVDVAYVDLRGEERSMRLSGFEAAVVQHEIDHLDGRLFIDRITDDADVNVTSLSRYRALREQHG